MAIAGHFCEDCPWDAGLSQEEEWTLPLRSASQPICARRKRMRNLTSVTLLAVVGWIAGCGQQSVPTVSQQSSELALTASATHSLDLTCFAGPCEGAIGNVNFTISLRPVDGAAPGFGTSPLGVYTVHGAPPNTTYLAQRAFDPILDGVCTAPFITWPFSPDLPSGPPPVRLTTSEGGAGAAHFSTQISIVPKGAEFDAVFNLIEESPNPGGTELRTECVRVTTR
jgi:hypothetical protein